MIDDSTLKNYNKLHVTMKGDDAVYINNQLNAIGLSINALNAVMRVSVGYLNTPFPLTALATQADQTVVANVSGGSASPVAVTLAALNLHLPVFTTTLNGIVTAPGTVTGKFLRDDGSWGTVSFTGYMQGANNLSDVASAATSRTNLGLGSASLLTAGVAANDAVQLNSSGQLPAVDGSLLTALPAITGRLVAGTACVLNPYAASTNVTQAHGLGVAPSFFSIVMECLTAEHGYPVGGQIRGGSPPLGLNASISADATNTTLSTTAGAPTIVDIGSHSFVAGTPANWKVTVTPYKLT